MASKPTRAPTKNDVELAKVTGNMATRQIVARGISWGIGILASALPLWIIFFWVKELAGKDTNVDFKGAVSIGLTVSVAPAVLVHLMKSRKSKAQSTQLIRLRERIKMLEEALEKTKS
jgi:hypothetical protein